MNTLLALLSLAIEHRLIPQLPYLQSACTIFAFAINLPTKKDEAFENLDCGFRGGLRQQPSALDLAAY